MAGQDEDGDDEPRRIKSVQRADEILKAIKSRHGATLQEIKTDLGLTKGTVHTYLVTLRECGFVTKEDDVYRLGLRFVTMGEYVRNKMDLYTAGQEQVDKLAERTGEYAHLVVEDGGQEVAIYESRGDAAIAMDYHLRLRETPQHLHDSAGGKAILAHLSEERLDEILDDRELAAQTENTITDREALREELATVRTRGYAVNDEEEIRGMRAVGAPILGSSGEVLGAVSVTAPTSRLKGKRFESDIPEDVMEAANLIEVNLETARFDQRD